MSIKENDTSAGQGIEFLAGQAAEYGCPWVLFSEDITGPPDLLRWMNLEDLKKDGWFPQAVNGQKATVIICRPPQELTAEIKSSLQVNEIEFIFTYPADLRRIIEHNQDLNPGFPPCAGRTPLARVRTHLAGRRSLLSLYRTLMAKSRTNLALVRTGFSFIAIALLFIRTFPPIMGTKTFAGLFLELPLLGLGTYMVVANMLKYLPARKINIVLPPYTSTTPTGGTSVLKVKNEEEYPEFSRTPEVAGAAELRANWSSLSPVMRRRFLASDRTDYAEERTTLACLRTWVANVRTWLAFVRTGGAFLGLGLGLIRAYPVGLWRIFDFALVGLGLTMIAEGLYWYSRGHQTAKVGFNSVKRMNAKKNIWDFFFPHRQLPDSLVKMGSLPIHRGAAAGIWATTGLALERTVLADRRNFMARLRTVMACGIRTGYSYIRTGLTLFFIGLVFAVYFHRTNVYWYCYEISMMLGGLALIVEGLLCALPAEKLRQQFPYCNADIEITIPDYGVPCRTWKKAIFDRETK